MPFRPDNAPAPVAAGRFKPDAAPAAAPLDPSLPRLPGEQGYQAPARQREKSIFDSGVDYVGDYVGGIKNSLFDPVEPKAPATVFESGISQVPVLGEAYGALESLGTLATSAVEPAIAGAKYALTGKESQPGDFTFTPRTPQGAALNRTAGAVMKPLGDLATESGADVALLPLAPELNNVQVPPSVRAGKAPQTKPNMRDPRTAARAADYKLLPSEAGGGKLTQALEAIGGPELKKDFRRANEGKTSQLAREDIDAPSLDPEGFQAVRDQDNAAYDALSSIGRMQPDDEVRAAIGGLSPRKGMRPHEGIGALQSDFDTLLAQPWDAGDVVTEVRQLRKEANANSSPPALGAKPDAKKQALAQAQLKIADALDDWLERNAQAVASPEAMTAYRGARRRLAKTASVERATSGGKVDVRNLEKQDDKNVPHSGRLKVASQTGEYFPESTGTAPGPVVNVPAGDIFTLTAGKARDMLVRPLVSKVLRSDMVQNRFGRSVPDTGAEGALGEYFDAPVEGRPYEPFAEAPQGPLPATPASGALRANQLAGDLELQPEGPSIDLPEAPSRLTAETPPAQRGDVEFTPSSVEQPPLLWRRAELLRGDKVPVPSDVGLSLADEIAGGSLPGGQAPRAPGMSEQVVPGTTGGPERRAIRSTKDVGIPLEQFSLADEVSQPLALEEGPSMVNLDDVLRLVDEPAPPAAVAAEAPAKPPKNAPSKKAQTFEPGPSKAPGKKLDAVIGDVPADAPPMAESMPTRLPPMQQQGKRSVDQPQKGQQQGLKAPQEDLGEVFVSPAAGGRSRLLADSGAIAEVNNVDELVPKAKQKGPKYSVDKESGEHTVETPEGALIMRPRGGFLRVQYAQVKPESRGKGKGLAMYEAAVKEAEKRGLTLASDTKVSKDAQRVYTALEKRGYKVTRNEVDIDPETGEATSRNSLKPAFEVRSAGSGET